MALQAFVFYLTGAVIMEGYYILFDRANKTVSFGATTCNPRLANVARSAITGYFNSEKLISSCVYNRPAKQLPAYAIALICIAAFLVTLLLVLLIIKMCFRLKRKRQRLRTDIDFGELMDDSFDTEY